MPTPLDRVTVSVAEGVPTARVAVAEGVIRARVREIVAEGDNTARVREIVAEGDNTAQVRVAVDETTPREREIVAVSVAVGETKCERVAVPLRETTATELGETGAIDDRVGDNETVPGPPP